jgi:hypothetical protein
MIDEDTAVQLVEPLRHVLLGHEVAHISGLSWKGKKDLNRQHRVSAPVRDHRPTKDPAIALLATLMAPDEPLPSAMFQFPIAYSSFSTPSRPAPRIEWFRRLRVVFAV